MSKTLDQIVTEKGCMTMSESIQVAKKLLELADKAHETGDRILMLSPERIRIPESAGECQLLINSENAARQDSCSNESTSNDHITAAGAVGFRAPEIAVTDPERIGKQSDYYSITAIFYYCLTGKKISRFQMFRSGIPDISDVILRNQMDTHTIQPLLRILKKGLAPGLKKRYQSSAQMRKDLLELEKAMRENRWKA